MEMHPPRFSIIYKRSDELFVVVINNVCSFDRWTSFDRGNGESSLARRFGLDFSGSLLSGKSTSRMSLIRSRVAMKTSIVIAAVIISNAVKLTEGNEKFECPVDCSSNVYRPICSRGKSYANLCVLQQEICKGKTAREIYDDVEACPDYMTEDDASGKSVETIDANGVIFRNLFNFTKEEISGPTETPKRSMIRPTKKLYYTKKDRKGNRLRRIRPLSRENAGPALLPFCVFRNALSPYHPFLRSFSTVPMIFVESFRFSSDESDIFGEGETPFDDSSEDEERRTNDSMFDENFCDLNCDPNEYSPVCVGKRAFRSECHLKKAFCSGSVGPDYLKIAKTCPPMQNKRKNRKIKIEPKN